MSIHRRGAKGIYHAAIYFGGKTVWKTLKTTDRETAKKKELNLRAGASSLGPTSRMPWKEFRAKYLEYSKREKTPTSYHNDIRTLDKFERILYDARMPIKYLSDFTRAAGEKFKEIRQGEVKPASVNRGLQLLKAMGKWAEDQEPPLVEVNPMRKVKKFSVPKGIGKPYSPEDMERLREACWDIVERLFVDLGYYTGRRRGEIARMRRDQIDFDLKVIYPSGGSNAIKDEGLVPLHSKLEETLREWYKESPKTKYVIELNGRPLLPGYISLNFKTKIAKRAGVGGSYHRLRHTFISRLTGRDVNMEKIRNMVGHKDISTTQGYSRNEIESVRKAVEQAL